MGRFVVEQGFHKGKVLPLNEGTHTLGRGKAADLQLLDDAISRKHAEIVVTNGLVVVKDLGSGNGTRVNKDKVKERPLVHGDLVEVGRHILRFEEDRTNVTRMLPQSAPEPEPIAPGPMPVYDEPVVAGRSKRFWIGVMIFLVVLGAVGAQRIYATRQTRQLREIERQAEAARQEVKRLNAMLDDAVSLSDKGDFEAARKKISEVAKSPAWAERVASARARVNADEARAKERARAEKEEAARKKAEDEEAARREAEGGKREPTPKKREATGAELLKLASRSFDKGEVQEAIVQASQVAAGSSPARVEAEKFLRQLQRFRKAFDAGARALANRDGRAAARDLEVAYNLAVDIAEDSATAEQARIELAKAHYLAGNAAFEANPREVRRARWHYRKVLTLDPHSQAGVYAQRMIEEVDQRTERAFLDAQAQGDPEERRRRLRQVMDMAEPGSPLFRRAQDLYRE